MFKKKLISMVLIGITVVGVTSVNTTISIATPTNTEASSNAMVEAARKGIESLDKVVNEGNYAKAISYRNYIKDQLTTLKKDGEDVTVLQMKFNDLSDEIESLGKKEKKINELKRLIKDSIRNIEYSLTHEVYKHIPNMFKTLSKNIDNLNKYQPIDQLTLNKVEFLKERYDQEKSGHAENLITSIETQLDNFSYLIEEKNIDKATSAEEQIESDIEKLAELSNVPKFIKDRFNLYAIQGDILYALREEGKSLNEEIRNLLNKSEKFIDIQDYDNARKSIGEAFKKNDRLFIIGYSDKNLTTRVGDIMDTFNKLDNPEKIPSTLLSPIDVEAQPVDEVQPMNLEEQPMDKEIYLDVQPVIYTPVNTSSNPKKLTELKNVNLDSPKNHEPKEEVNITNLVDAKKNDKSKEEINATKLVDDETIDKSKEEVKAIKLVDDMDEDMKVDTEVSNQGEATTTINILPKTGKLMSGQGLLGIGIIMSTVGAITLKMFRKN